MEAQRLGKSSSLSLGLGGGRVLDPGKGELVSGSSAGLVYHRHHTLLPNSQTYFEGAATGPGPVVGKASWLTGPFVEASLEPYRHEMSSGESVRTGLGKMRC